MDKAVEKKKKWTEEEERILSDILLAFTKDGKTQREAFEKAAHTIGRTPGACSFRWNNKLKNKVNTHVETTASRQPSIADCISYLQTLSLDGDLAEENLILKEHQNELKLRLQRAEKTFIELKTKYKDLVLQVDTQDGRTIFQPSTTEPKAQAP
ncbi:MAG: hypothetical protein ACQEUT_04050 [Bacillota bacterium]